MDILIVGAGGHARVVLDILRAANLHRPVGFLDADETLHGTTMMGLPILGHPQHLSKLRGKARGAIIAIGNNTTRQAYARQMTDAGLELINAVHPSALLSSSAKLGKNLVIAAGAIVSTEAQIGDACILNTGSITDHECHLGSGVHLAPGAILAGRVRVGNGAFIGLGAKVIQCLTIGDGATIGAGATVIRDVPSGVTVVGTPARAIER
jgi:UDP-perosamine 4-acetyltransferase